jgi:hypothetical protein
VQTTDNIQSGIVRKDALLSVPRPCFIKDGGGLLHIIKEHVVYLLSDDHVCKLYIKGKRTPIVLSLPFKNLTGKLCDVLTTIRRGTAVNLHYATTIKGGVMKLAWDCGEAELAYSEEGYKNILSAIDLLE